MTPESGIIVMRPGSLIPAIGEISKLNGIVLDAILLDSKKWPAVILQMMHISKHIRPLAMPLKSNALFYQLIQKLLVGWRMFQQLWHCRQSQDAVFWVFVSSIKPLVFENEEEGRVDVDWLKWPENLVLESSRWLDPNVKLMGLLEETESSVWECRKFLNEKDFADIISV